MISLWQSFTTAAPDLLRTMARHEVQTTIFILVLLVADSLLKRTSPRFRYALWLVALAKALWPPFLSLPALDFASRQPIVTETLAPVTPVLSTPVIQAPAMVTSVAEVPGPAPTLTWGAVFLGVWVVIALVVVALMIVNYVRFRLRLRPPRVERYQFDEPESAVGRPWPPIWATDRIHSPLTVGLLRPRIYLTWKVIASGARELRAILYHELAHILRRDGWITLLQAAALVIHPFNPLVWLMNARLSRYREQLCDDFALRHTGVTPKDYGNMLLNQLSQAKVPLLAVHTPTYFFETKRDLVYRLHQLMKRKGELMNRITSLQKILLGGFLFGLLMIASQCAEQAVSIPTSQATTENANAEEMDPFYLRVLQNIMEASGFSDSDSVEVIPAGYGQSSVADEFNFILPRTGYIKVYIVDDQGRNILDLYSGAVEKTHIFVLWNGTLRDGRQVPTGVYRCLVEMEDREYASDSYFGKISSGGQVVANVADAFFADSDNEDWDFPPTPVGGYTRISTRVQSQYSGAIPPYVLIQCEIDPEGSASASELRDPPPRFDTPSNELENIIREVIQSTRWEPALKDNQPVPATVWVPIFEAPQQEDSSPTGAAEPLTPDAEIQRSQPSEPDNSLINLRTEYAAALERMRGTESAPIQEQDTLREPIGLNELRAGYEAALERMRAMEDTAAAGTRAVQGQ